MIKKLFLMVACLMAVPLAACTSTGGPALPGTVTDAVEVANQPVGDLTVIDEKAMYAAEALYNVPAHAYVTADSHFGDEPRWLAVKPVVKPKLEYAYQLLGAARTAYAAGDAVTFNDKLRALQLAKDEIMALIPTAGERG